MEIDGRAVSIARVAGKARAITGRAGPAAGRAFSRRRLRGRIQAGSKLHLGCGRNRFAGWVHIDRDLSVRPDIVHDLRWGLPGDSGVASLIYSEHVLEHLSLPCAIQLLGDCRSVLDDGGVLRIAMPDLAELVRAYQGEWRDQPWLDDPGFAYIDTPARMLNVSMREWGHQYLYDRGELELRLRDAGFDQIRWCAWGRSDEPELTDRETRLDSRLIAEAVAA